jgi:hypothetical protein
MFAALYPITFMKFTMSLKNVSNAIEFSGRAVIPNAVWKELNICLNNAAGSSLLLN